MSGKTDDLRGASAPVLSPALLARVCELNCDYLELLSAQYQAREEAGQFHWLPAKLHASLAELSHAPRRLLAAVPYSLYSLGFERAAFWRTIGEGMLQSAPVPLQQRYATSVAVRLQEPFCEIALLYAWHVAMSNPLAARVLFAMPEATAQRLVAMPLWCIKRIAVEHPGLLMPRWPTNPAFWPDLVRFAAAGDMQRLATAKLLGSHLIAAELDSAAPVQDGAAARWSRSPRLRARKLQFEGSR